MLIALARLSRIPNIARFSGRAGLAWRHAFDNGTAIEADGWLSYVGKSRLGIGPELGELQGDYLDSGVIIRFGRENAGLTLTITNLAGSEGNRFALLERLTQELLDLVMSNGSVLYAEVEVDKPHALRFAESVSITLAAHR